MRIDPRQAAAAISRRQFVGVSACSLAAFGAAAPEPPAQGIDPDGQLSPLLAEKIGVKFVYGGVIHQRAHEGPCRIGRLEDLSYEAELARHESDFQRFANALKARQFPPATQILEPADFQMIVPERSVEFVFPEEQFAKLQSDLDQVDLFVLVRGFVSDIAVRLGRRTNKPIATLGNDWVVDVPAALRHYGLEGYVALDWEDLHDLVQLLWVRRAFARTRLLVITDRFGQPPFGLASAICDFNSLAQRYGMQTVRVSNGQLTEEIDRIRDSRQHRERAEQVADRLIRGAEAVHMSKEHIVHSVHFYLAVAALMARGRCNAFTIECREICPLEIAARYKFTPCLALSLLKDAGYPTVCQTDINALLAMMALSLLGRRSVYMGNPVFDVKRNVVKVFHDVPGLQMKGFAAPPLPYQVRNFTVGGWGATLRYDFSLDRGAAVTLARFNPGQTKMLVAAGEIVGGFGVDQIGCSLGVEVRVADARQLFRQLANYGGHLVMAYGDHVARVRDLGRLMPFEVVAVG